MPGLAPPPINDPSGSYAWLEWYRQLRNYLVTSGEVPWNVINKSGSNLQDLQTRLHNGLQSVQGGQAGQYYHLTQAEYAAITAGHGVTSVAVNTTMTELYEVYLVTASGKTMTLPAASSGLIGRKWTVQLATDGYVDVTRSGSDTILLPTTETTIRLTNKGANVTLRCLTATSWGIE